MVRHSTRASWRRLLFRSGSLVLVAIVIGGGMASAAPLREPDFKAATLSKIIPYVSWPRTKAPLVVGLYGSDPFGGRLHQLLKGTTTRDGRPIQVRVVKDVSELSQCHVLFVPSSKSRDWARLSRGVPPQGQLTVGEDSRFATEMGGICNLSFPARELEINRSNARTADLKISSRLLKIATLVGR